MSKPRPILLGREGTGVDNHWSNCLLYPEWSAGEVRPRWARLDTGTLGLPGPENLAAIFKATYFANDQKKCSPLRVSTTLKCAPTDSGPGLYRLLANSRG